MLKEKIPKTNREQSNKIKMKMIVLICKRRFTLTDTYTPIYTYIYTYKKMVMYIQSNLHTFVSFF